MTRPSALQCWESFDLNGRRAVLDQQGLDIADRQEASASARKRLAVSTRAFKKGVSEGVPVSAKAVGALLREYQGEVDALTNRAKGAESSFLALYKALYEAPDPVDELRKLAGDRVVIAELREELRALRDERGGLVERTAAATKYERRIAELEGGLKAMGDRVAEEARVQIEEKQAQWMAAQHSTIEAYELREQELLHQISLGNDSARRLQSTADGLQQQLNESRAQLEDVKANRVNESDMVVEDLERARTEAKGLRRRCIELETKVSEQDPSGDGARESVGGESSIGRSALSAELASRDVEVSQLKDQVSALEEVLSGKDQEKSAEFAKLASSISNKDEELRGLRSTVSKLPTLEQYETMTRQFETLQAFQLNDSSADANSGPDTDGGSLEPDAFSGQVSPSVRASADLEKRLLGKVKNLESRLTRMRVDLGDRDSRIQELLGVTRSFEEQVEDQKALISRLEDGINVMTGDQSGVQAMKRRAAAASVVDQTDTGTSEGTVAPATGATAVTVPNAGGRNDDASALAESTWDWGEQHQATGLQNIIPEEPTMLDIVAGQRDRFRSRTMELEDDSRKLMERIEKLTSDLDALKSDNVRLYEKIRFIQSYKQQTSGGGNPGALAASASAPMTDLAQSGGDEEDGVSGFIGKYRSMYEDMVNPYTIFNRRERHKRMSEMNVAERFTLRAGQRALSTKTSRLLVFCYVVALHVLVVFVLGLSASSPCEGDVTTKAHHG